MTMHPAVSEEQQIQMVQADREVLRLIEIHSVAGAIANTTDPGDGSKTHVMIHNGKKITVCFSSIEYLQC